MWKDFIKSTDEEKIQSRNREKEGRGREGLKESESMFLVVSLFFRRRVIFRVSRVVFFFCVCFFLSFFFLGEKREMFFLNKEEDY